MIQVQSSNSFDPGVEARRKDALIVTCIELVVAVLGFAIGLRAYIITSNIKAGAFWSHVALAVACVFLLIGVNHKEKGKTLVLLGIVLNAAGILMAFIATVIDGAAAGHVSRTNFNKCRYSEERNKIECANSDTDNYHCSMDVTKNSCYCCDVFRKNKCENWGYSISSQPSIYKDVDSCGRVESEFQLCLWISMALNILQFAVATVTCSLIGRYKAVLKRQNRVYPLSHTIVGPSVISSGTGAVVIFNHQSLGYHPPIMRPPEYSEIVGIGNQVVPQPGVRSQNRPYVNPAHPTPIGTTSRAWQDNLDTSEQYPGTSAIGPQDLQTNGRSHVSPINVHITQHAPQYRREYSLPPPYSP